MAKANRFGRFARKGIITVMQRLRREKTRVERGARYSVMLTRAMFQPEQRRFVYESLAFARSLPRRLDQPLPAALLAMTPAPVPQSLDNDTIRGIADALTAFGAGRPLGICLRRSLTRYHFLRRAGLPVVVYFGARRLGDGIGGHAWLVLDGEPYHELPQHYLNYAVMYTYPAAGESPTSAPRPPGTPDGRIASADASDKVETSAASGNPPKTYPKEITP